MPNHILLAFTIFQLSLMIGLVFSTVVSNFLHVYTSVSEWQLLQISLIRDIILLRVFGCSKRLIFWDRPIGYNNRYDHTWLQSTRRPWLYRPLVKWSCICRKQSIMVVDVECESNLINFPTFRPLWVELSRHHPRQMTSDYNKCRSEHINMLNNVRPQEHHQLVLLHIAHNIAHV